MDNLEIYDSVFIEIFHVEKNDLDKLKHNETYEWDSLTHMTIIALLEEKFNIMFEIDDIIDFISYQEGKVILRKYGKDI